MPNFEQGSYTDPKHLPKSSNLYHIAAGFIFKDEELGDALRGAWRSLTLEDELPPVHEAKAMKKAFADYLMGRKERREFATFGKRHHSRKKAELSILYDYAVKFIKGHWGTQFNPFGETQ